MRETEQHASNSQSYRAAWRQEIKDQGNRAWTDARAFIHRVIPQDEITHIRLYVGTAEAQREGTRARKTIRTQIDNLRALIAEMTPKISEERLATYIRAHQPTTDSVPPKPSLENPVRSFLRSRIHPTSHLHS